MKKEESMKKIFVLFAVVVAVVVVMTATAVFANGVAYLSDGNITVKVWQKNISDQLRHSGWKDVAVTDKIAAEVSEYGPKEDPGVITELGVFIYPISNNPAIRQDRKYCAKWYAYSLEGYTDKVVARLADLSALLKK